MITQDDIDAFTPEEDLLEKYSQILMQTNDPRHLINRDPVPALTTLLHRVCDNDVKKFDEAMRLVTLFIQKALEKKDG
jgi:hypothetical protein